MSFEIATKKDVRMKVVFCGLAGSGKTLSALKMASGLVNGDMSTVGVVETEPGRAVCYLDLVGPFKIQELAAPFSPERYTKKIQEAIDEGIKVLIIDSISDEWISDGGIYLQAEAMKAVSKTSNPYTKLTPKHDRFINKIMGAPIHILCTVRQDAKLSVEKVGGKTKYTPVPEKDVQRKDLHYKFMLSFQVDRDTHECHVRKDNTNLFGEQASFLMKEETGKQIRDWCLS